ncbi:CAAX amino terminal protease self- immunity [Symmachiella macrocystis]|uniref:CAAX amino terminal protease self-immunity n=1 Tax=Symmachiella macrocystis TaxID=2527985 RepID=A0A5C6BQ59_9PLAN|nr:CPBP family intramembrane glutamic endopeptidase [Symmachiella macrocystis]TWU12754.1 CAAX amino terminal protease self- immunity [Symmachiella macrocystis]
MQRTPDNPALASAPRRIAHAVALLVVFAAIVVCVKWIDVSSFARWQTELLYWNYAAHVLMIAVAIGASLTLKRRWAEYGLTGHGWKRGVLIGLCSGATLALLPLLLEGVFGQLALQSRIAGYWISTIVFQVLFVGFGEELLFRGFFQAEWNRVFARRFHIGRVRFGFGLLATALLFGIAHWLNPFNPLRDRFALDWPALFFTTNAGLILGFSRELTGSLVAAVLVHVAADVYPALFLKGTPGGIGMAVGWGVAVAVLIFAAHSWVDGDATPAEPQGD